MDILTTVSTRRTPQSAPADSRQRLNRAGGYTFVADADTRLHRFLTLGTDGGTYHTSARELTSDNAAVVRHFAETRPADLVAAVTRVSLSGSAPRQNPAIFALAMCAGLADATGRRLALEAIPDVCRTATHLFLFVRYVDQFRGWGRGLRAAVASWYTDPPVDKVAHQALKYRQREGFTHRDVLRLSHPEADDASRAALFDFVVRGRVTDDLPAIVHGFVEAQSATSVAAWVDTIKRHPDMSWEMLPDAALGHRGVWEQLLANGIPQTALMRQLPRLTRLGLAGGSTGRTIAGQLADAAALKRARVHPINVLVAQRAYASGRSPRGEGEWTPAPAITDALDAAFYAAFGAVEPSGKRTLLALDVSGSMTAAVSGLPITCREASGALAMVTAAVEPQCHPVVGFTGGGRGGHPRLGRTALTQLDISPRRRLDDNLRAISNLPFGSTDCSLPMVWALQSRIEVDTFQVYTDNETFYGGIHPHQALREYREKMGIDARLAVVAMTADGASLADPSDPGQLDVSGFDGSVPQLLADFSRGGL